MQNATASKYGIDNLKLVLHPTFTAISAVVNLDADRDGKVSLLEGGMGAYSVTVALAPAFPYFDEARDEIEDLDADEFQAVLEWAENDFQLKDRALVTQIVKRTLNAVRYNHAYARFVGEAIRRIKAGE